MRQIFQRDASRNFETKHVNAKKAFQKLWVAGALGAFFTSVARTIPLDIRHLAQSPTYETASNTLLRYLYMVWLVWYFFLSNLRSQSSDPPRVNEILFDIVQSVAAFIAVFYLDFLVANEHHGLEAFAVANFAIAAIGFLSWFWFRFAALQLARFTGFIIALGTGIACIWVFPHVDACCARNFLIIAAVGLLMTLWPFHRQRIQNPTEPPQGR